MLSPGHTAPQRGTQLSRLKPLLPSHAATNGLIIARLLAPPKGGRLAARCSAVTRCRWRCCCRLPCPQVGMLGHCTFSIWHGRRNIDSRELVAVGFHPAGQPNASCKRFRCASCRRLRTLLTHCGTAKLTRCPKFLCFRPSSAFVIFVAPRACRAALCPPAFQRRALVTGTGCLQACSCRLAAQRRCGSPWRGSAGAGDSAHGRYGAVLGSHHS